MTQGDISDLAFRLVYTRIVELHHAGLFAGAACFRAVSGISLETKLARAAGHAPKRLPSRRWAIAHHMNVSHLSITRTSAKGPV